MQPPSLPEHRPSSNTEPLAQRTWVVVAALVLFFPAGLVLAWRRPGWTQKTKLAITSVVALVAILVAAMGPATPTPHPKPAPSHSAEAMSAPSPEVIPAPTPTPTLESPTPEPVDPIPVEYVTIARVIDGDTAEVASPDGSTTRVRFIGVDSPESTTRIEPFGKEASAYMKNLLPVGKGVYLERDVEELDRYGRLLAYVWLSKPVDDTDVSFARTRMVNALLLVKGWAQVSTFPPNVKYVDHFKTFQTESRSAELGMWAPQAPAPKPESSGGGGGNCDPSYPDVCIPSPPPDLDCGDISYRNFRVVGDDPHGFDGNDNDGRGCES